VLRLTALDGRATPRAASAEPTALPAAPTYARHVCERTLLYALVQAHYPDFIARLTAEDRSLPETVREEFEAFLRCGVLENGFLRVVCEHCHAERLLAFSCKKRGFCPSCGARRMAESARHLVEEVFGPRPVRQWVLSVPVPLRFLFASKPDAIGPVLGIVHRVIAGWLAAQTGVDRATAQSGAVTLIQRFGSALNLTNSPGANLNSRRLARRAKGRMPGVMSTFICCGSMACMSQWPPGRTNRACIAPVRRRPRS